MNASDATAKPSVSDPSRRPDRGPDETQRPGPVPQDSAAGVSSGTSADCTTTLATRRLSISATRSSQSVEADPLALLGDVPEGVEEEAAEGHVLALGER